MDCFKLSASCQFPCPHQTLGSTTRSPATFLNNNKNNKSLFIAFPTPRSHRIAIVCGRAPKGPSSETSTSDGLFETIDDVHGLSGKSRGDVFLEKALMKRSSLSERGSHEQKAPQKTALAGKKKDKVPVKSTEPCCYGCGALLQTSESDAPGYVPSDIFVTKKKHHQLKTVLCGRCRLLTHGQMIPAVGGHGGYGGGKRFISAEQLRLQLSHLRNEKALIIKLVDIVDFNGSFLTRIRDLVGANPIMLVATKVDLLPKGTDLNTVGDWLVESILRKKLNVITVHMTSSKSLLGISSVVSYLQQQRQGRDIYILGSANVGKSAFVNALLQALAQRDPIATAALRHMPIQSAMPGTTLGPIQIDAFSGGGSLFDTPGIHLHHRMAAVVPPEDLTRLAPHRRLRGYPISPWKRKRKMVSAFEVLARSFEARGDKGLDHDSYLDLESTSEISSGEAEVANGNGRILAGLSIFWGGIARLDVVKAPPDVSLRLYGPTAVPIFTVSTSEADSFYKKELGRILTPPTGEESPKTWPGLQSQHSLRLTLEHADRPACDIAISGLGWVTVEAGYTANSKNLELEVSEKLDTEMHVVVHVPKGIEVFVRPPIPVGVHGSEWYEYLELSEKEQEARPRLFCS